VAPQLGREDGGRERRAPRPQARPPGGPLAPRAVTGRAAPSGEQDLSHAGRAPRLRVEGDPVAAGVDEVQADLLAHAQEQGVALEHFVRAHAVVPRDPLMLPFLDLRGVGRHLGQRLQSAEVHLLDAGTAAGGHRHVVDQLARQPRRAGWGRGRSGRRGGNRLERSPHVTARVGGHGAGLPVQLAMARANPFVPVGPSRCPAAGAGIRPGATLCASRRYRPDRARFSASPALPCRNCGDTADGGRVVYGITVGRRGRELNADRELLLPWSRVWTGPQPALDMARRSRFLRATPVPSPQAAACSVHERRALDPEALLFLGMGKIRRCLAHKLPIPLRPRAGW